MYLRVDVWQGSEYNLSELNTNKVFFYENLNPHKYMKAKEEYLEPFPMTYKKNYCNEREGGRERSSD